VDDETDRRIGAIEVKQQLRDARCAACRSKSRKEFRIALDVRWLAVMAVVLMLVCVALAAVTLDASMLRLLQLPRKILG
jgi:hypothetical protein